MDVTRPDGAVDQAVDQPGPDQAGFDAGIDAGTDAGVDLTPRDLRPRGKRRRGVWGTIAVVAVVAAIGLVLWNGLSQATVFFYNVDQAVAKKQEIGDKRFRMQGNVVKGSVQQHHGGLDFRMKYGGKTVQVAYSGEPSELFGPAIPVVMEGHFVGDRFVSDSMLIRHDNDYDQKNKVRVQQAEKDAQQQS
jgi:cytochrome c-type biogenesis protein CcmE